MQALDVVVLTLCAFLGNAGVALAGFGMAIIYLFVYQIAVLAGYSSDFKYAVFLQALALFAVQVRACARVNRCVTAAGLPQSAEAATSLTVFNHRSIQPLIFYEADMWNHASSRMLRYFIPITIAATPLGQLLGETISTEVIEAVAGVLVSSLALFEVYHKREQFATWLLCRCWTTSSGATTEAQKVMREEVSDQNETTDHLFTSSSSDAEGFVDSKLLSHYDMKAMVSSLGHIMDLNLVPVSGTTRLTDTFGFNSIF
jgi:hypothetical protein